MADTSALIQQFRQMPRVMQWVAVAAAGLVLFVIWDQAIRPQTEAWGKQADVIQSNVAKVRASETVARDLRLSEPLVKALGPVRVPVPIAEGSRMFNDVVLGVLEKHGVTPNFSVRSRGKLPKTSLTEVTSGSKRIDRLTGDLKFDATPAAAVAIISELESSPHIESIGSLRMVRDTGGRVKVQLTIEAWTLATDAVKGPTT